MSQAPALALLPNPDLAGVYRFRPAAVGPALPRLVHRMLELFDEGQSVAQVCCCLQITEAQGLAIVRKLSGLGLIEASGADRTRTSLSAFEQGQTLRDLPSHRADFSADEEAFFASEVQPGDEEQAPSLGEKVSLFVSDLVLRLQGVAL